MRGGEGNSSECFAVHAPAGAQAARASVRRPLRCYAGLYRRVGLLLLHRGLLLQLGVADIPEGPIRRHRHPPLPRLSGGHQATAGEARGAGSPPHRQRDGICLRTFCQPSGSVRHPHQFTSVNGPKRNGRVERRIALVKEGARAAWLGFPRLFPDLRFPSRAMHYSAVWPEAWIWMSENINITSRVDGPDTRCPEEKLYGKRLRKQLVPFLMPGHRTRGSGPKWAGKADPCFYLNGGNDHASDCDKVMLESGIVSYTTNATYACRRVPFVGQQVTFGNGVIRAPSPPTAATSMGGSGTSCLAGQSGESDAVTAPSSPPAASSAGRGDVGVLKGHPGRRWGIGGGTPLPSLSPVALSTEGDTSGLRSQPEEWRKSDRLDIPAQQDNPRSQSRLHTVTPAVTRSAARTQLGVGDQPGAFTVLSAMESISVAIATSAAPHSDSSELPTCPTCDLETPATHAQAHARPHSKIWRAAEDKEFGGLRAVGTFEELGGT